MAKQKFSPMALDDILSDAIADTKDLQEELSIFNDDPEDIVPVPGVSPQVNNLLEPKSNGGAINYDKVYLELERLIENGNIALQVLGAIDPDVSGMEVAASTATLMNAVKNCVAEFTKIHMQHLKFQQTLQIMELKHKYKMEEMAKRKELYSTNSPGETATNVTEMIPWQTEGAIEYINFMKEKENKK